MRVRVTVEYDVAESLAKQGSPNVRKQVRELVENWPSTFKPVLLSVETVREKAAGAGGDR